MGLYFPGEFLYYHHKEPAMIETMTTEMLLTGAILGASALALLGGISMLRPPREARSTVNLDDAVRKAPYHRLHNVLPPHKS